VNYLQGLGASKIKDLSGSVGGEGSPGHIALHAVLACSGAAAQGANCGAGAVGASASIVVSSLLQKISGKDSEMLGAEDKDQRANQLVSIIAGIAGALSPEQAATIANAARLEAENNTLRDHTQVHSARFDEKVKALADCVGERSCQTAAGHFEGWIRVIDEHEIPACGGDATCLEDRLAERNAYAVGQAIAKGRLNNPLIAGIDLLDARNQGNYDRLQLKGALVRFQSEQLDYARDEDRFVAESMMSSPVVFAAVKGLSPLDSDGGGGKGRSSTGSSSTRKTPVNVGDAKFADREKLLSHFHKHGAEFRAKTPEEYLELGGEIIKNGEKVQYLYKGEKRTGYVKFMENSSRGDAKFGFVGTNSDGAITPIHVESGRSFWKMLNGNSADKNIRPVP